MSVLAAIAYDPTTAVTKATSAALAMTALDTSNLRCVFAAPANGRVMVRLNGTIHGATTFPQVLLGVLEGSTVRARTAPNGYLNGTALATTFLTIEALIPIGGLTPGATYTWDAAYGVETPAASTGIKYGGPNDATANNGFGAFIFEVWDTA